MIEPKRKQDMKFLAELPPGKWVLLPTPWMGLLAVCEGHKSRYIHPNGTVEIVGPATIHELNKAGQ